MIGGLIFYGYGLNLLGVIGPAQGLGPGVVVFAGRVVASNLWLRYFRYGPLEWLWRSANFLEVQPFARRRPAAADAAAEEACRRRVDHPSWLPVRVAERTSREVVA